MFNTTIIDRKVTKQEVSNYNETNVESSGSISKTENNTRFININKNNRSFTTVFSSNPFYVEIEQKPIFETIKTKIYIQVKQVLVVGLNYILEIQELDREDISDKDEYSWGLFLNRPTIL